MRSSQSSFCKNIFFPGCVCLPRKLSYEHLTPAFLQQNNLCEFRTREHKFKG